MEEETFRPAWSGRREAHTLDHVAILLKGAARDLQEDRDRHDAAA